MARKKTSGRVQQQQSFQEIVASQTLAKFKPYIDQQLNGSLQALVRRFLDLNEQVAATQELLMELVPGFTGDVLSEKLVVIKDRQLGLEKVEGRRVQLGDTVRVTLASKLQGAEEGYTGETPLLVSEIGEGNTLGKDIEAGIIGMTTNETKEIVVGEATFKVTLDRISAKPTSKEEGTEVSDAGTDAG